VSESPITASWILKATMLFGVFTLLSVLAAVSSSLIPVRRYAQFNYARSDLLATMNIHLFFIWSLGPLYAMGMPNYAIGHMEMSRSLARTTLSHSVKIHLRVSSRLLVSRG